MKKQLLFTFFAFGILNSFSQDFITTWKTDNPGNSNATSITIPTFPGETYNYDIDWDNDGVFDDMGITGSIVHDFGTSGTYTIRIKGLFPRIFFNNGNGNGGDREKILSVDQWGTISWNSMQAAFAGAAVLEINATDSPDLSNVTSLNSMFANCQLLNQDISGWDTSAITDMSFMFLNAISFNQPLNTWNIENVSNFSNFLTNVKLSELIYESLLINWNNQNLKSNVTFNGGNSQYCSPTAAAARANLTAMNNWSITDGGQACPNYFKTTWKTDNPGNSNSSSITIGTNAGRTYSYDVDWDNDGVFDDTGITGNITHDFGSVGEYTIAIKGLFPQFASDSGGDSEKIISIDQWGTNPWESMEFAFYKTSNLIGNASDVPDLSNVSSLLAMFAESSFNQDIGNWNISTIINLSNMFAFNLNFNQDISSWDTQNVVNLNNMFDGAMAFNQDISNWNTSMITGMQGVFRNASSFDQNLGNWNVENVTTFNLIFSGITLSSTNYDNILIGWDAQNLNPNMNLDGGSSEYCSVAAETARNNMIASDGWTITDGGACASLSVNDVELNTISLFPNPSNSQFSIKGLQEASNINIYDITGKAVFAMHNYRDTIIDIKSFKSGLYIVKVKNNKGSKTLKLLVD